MVLLQVFLRVPLSVFHCQYHCTNITFSFTHVQRCIISTHDDVFKTLTKTLLRIREIPGSNVTLDTGYIH
jgi:hypothetical protein